MPCQGLWKEAALMKLFHRLKRNTPGSHILLQAHLCWGHSSMLARNKALWVGINRQQQVLTLTPNHWKYLPRGELRASQKIPIDSEPVWKLILYKPSSASIHFSCGPTLHLLSLWFHIWVPTGRHIWDCLIDCLGSSNSETKNLYPLTWNGNVHIPSPGNSSRENKLIEVKDFLNCNWQTLFLQHFMIICKLKMAFNASKLLTRG